MSTILKTIVCNPRPTEFVFLSVAIEIKYSKALQESET